MKEKIYDEYYNKIYYWSLKKMKNREDALDLLNDIFVQVYTYLNKNIKINNIDNLIWAIAFNTWKNRLKIITKDKVLIYDDIKVNQIGFNNNEVDKILYKDILDNLDNYNLTLKEKECFNMYYRKDYSIKEICSVIGSTESNIKYYLYSARKKIKEKYDE